MWTCGKHPENHPQIFLRSQLKLLNSQMTLKEIDDRLIKGIASITSLDESSITSDTPFNELGIDSMGLIEIFVFIETTFKLKLIETDIKKKDLETIRSLASFVNKML